MNYPTWWDDGGAPNSDYQQGLSDLRPAGVTMIGYVYVTNDGGTNPWDTLPAYWSELASYVEG